MTLGHVNETPDGTGNHALRNLFHGINRFNNGYNRHICQRRYSKTLWGLFGGLLFWTGWIEFIYVYYAHRFGVQPLIIDGEVVTKPEYLIMPSSFGF